ncbi:carbohydrate ABC transporter permease [Streptomyces sp. NPDC057557]|uniref:carbohydrate ABC transporter permease n=1 Tax=Streptomyces sp. NPDC057557 TaxID=3346167 RepID=UPI0036B4FDE2
MSLAPPEHAPATPADRGIPTRTGRTRPGRRRLLTRGSVPYLLIRPAVLGFAIFKAYPIVSSLWISLTTGNGDDRHFTGLANYRRLLDDPLFWTALKNTALIRSAPPRTASAPSTVGSPRARSPSTPT